MPNGSACQAEVKGINLPASGLSRGRSRLIGGWLLLLAAGGQGHGGSGNDAEADIFVHVMYPLILYSVDSSHLFVANGILVK